MTATKRPSTGSWALKTRPMVPRPRVAPVRLEAGPHRSVRPRSRGTGPIEGDDLHTHTTLEEVLEKLTREVPGLRVAVGFQTEEGDEDVLAYAHGEPWDEGLPEDAPSADARRGTRSVSGYARYLEASAEATEAVAADDVGVMLRLLDDPRLAAPSLSETRHPRFRLQQLDGTRFGLWRAIVTKPRDLPLDRTARAIQVGRW